MRTLNRAAVAVTPKEPFLDWLRSLEESNRELTMANIQRSPSIYLFPECNFESELLEQLESSCPEIFEQELESWDRLEETWPKDRSFGAFQQWFDYSIHWMIFDLSGGRIRSEEI